VNADRVPPQDPTLERSNAHAFAVREDMAEEDRRRRQLIEEYRRCRQLIEEGRRQPIRMPFSSPLSILIIQLTTYSYPNYRWGKSFRGSDATNYRRANDVNALPTRDDGRTALQAAARDGHQRVAKPQTGAGADVNALPAEDNGGTGLQAAAEGGHSGGMKPLIDAGTNVNAPSAGSDGRTVL
jgi:hypothetical protein